MFNALGAVSDLLDFAGAKVPAVGIGPIGRRDLYPVKIDSIDLPTDCIVQVSMGKNIIQQDVPGGDGTIKTMVGYRDMEVSITGRIITKSNSLMLKELKTLVALFNIEDALPIQCPYTDVFGIKKIVLSDFEPMIRENYRSILWFSFRGVSDEMTDRIKEIKMNNLQALRAKIRNQTGLV